MNQLNELREIIKKPKEKALELLKVGTSIDNIVKKTGLTQEEIKSLILVPKEPAGTQYYTAPEIEEGKQYDQKVDVFSMGICFYALCFFGLPDSSSSPNYMSQLYSDQIYSKELKDIIKKMIDNNPFQRPTSSEIFKLFKRV